MRRWQSEDIKKTFDQCSNKCIIERGKSKGEEWKEYSSCSKMLCLKYSEKNCRKEGPPTVITVVSKKTVTQTGVQRN